MTYSNRGGSNFGGQNYGRRDFNDRGSDRPAMFDAICAKCGANCQLPFKPNGRREVFCSKCFETQQGGSSRESGYGGSRTPRMYDKRDDRQMFRPTGGTELQDINVKLDKILKLLTPSDERIFKKEITEKVLEEIVKKPKKAIKVP